jgi:hypothetical protein
VRATTTVPGQQTSGPRTVLSPTGLHVRAGPSRTAPILRTAAAGTTLEVLGHTTLGGGWYRVKGETVTGWISDATSLSAPGKFSSFTSAAHQFGVLYPVAWTTADSPALAVFRAPGNAETIAVNTAPSVAGLGGVHAGYSQIRSEQIVACGITGDLNTYAREVPAGATAPWAYFARVRLALDAKHALAIAGYFQNPSQVQAVRDFANSITFAAARCEG